MINIKEVIQMTNKKEEEKKDEEAEGTEEPVKEVKSSGGCTDIEVN